MNANRRIRLSIAVLMITMALATIGALGPALASPDPRIVIIRVEDARTGIPIYKATVKLYKQPNDVPAGTYQTDLSGETPDITCDDNTWYTVTARKGNYYAGTKAFYTYSSVETLRVVIRMQTTTGGFAVPVDKFGLLAPYIGVVSTIVVVGISATSIYVKRRKEN